IFSIGSDAFCTNAWAARAEPERSERLNTRMADKIVLTSAIRALIDLASASDSSSVLKVLGANHSTARRADKETVNAINVSLRPVKPRHHHSIIGRGEEIKFIQTDQGNISWPACCGPVPPGRLQRPVDWLESGTALSPSAVRRHQVDASRLYRESNVVS